MDKSGDAAQLNIRDEPLTCPVTPIRGTGEEEMNLNLAADASDTLPRRSGVQGRSDQVIRKLNKERLDANRGG
jgi:hypothetical protein